MTKTIAVYERELFSIIKPYPDHKDITVVYEVKTILEIDGVRYIQKRTRSEKL